MEPEVYSSGFLLFRKQGAMQFLLMKHAHRWDLPKGHLDAGETKLQAAERELFEETGIESKDVWIDPDFAYVNRYMVSYRRDGGKKRLKELTIYLALLKRDLAIVATEHQGFEWFDWKPPHKIQAETIDPLLEQVESHFLQKRDWPTL